MENENFTSQKYYRLSKLLEDCRIEEIKMRKRYKVNPLQKIRRKFQKFLDRYQMMQVLYWKYILTAPSVVIVEKSELCKGSFMWENSHKFHMNRANQRCSNILPTTLIWPITDEGFFRIELQRSTAR